MINLNRSYRKIKNKYHDLMFFICVLFLIKTVRIKEKGQYINVLNEIVQVGVIPALINYNLRNDSLLHCIRDKNNIYFLLDFGLVQSCAKSI